jgi:hypothetical protein
MSIVSGGQNFYGNSLGILVLDVKYPAIPGNVANACSYDFPVRFKVMDMPTDWWCDDQGPDDERYEIYLQAAKELEAEGVKAITSGCGFFAVYQKRAVKELNIPLFASPLLMVPMVSKMIGENKKVGIITAGAKNLQSGPFLEDVGITKELPVVFGGMDDSPHFQHVIMNDNEEVDPDLFIQEIVNVTVDLQKRNPDIGAFVFECSDLPPATKAVSKATGLPVFDFISLAHLVNTAIFPKEYKGFM